MWFKKKEKSSAIHVKMTPFYNVAPKEKTRDAIMGLLIVNNKTEKEYIYKSENNFGLDWETVDGWLHIKQIDSKGEWRAIAALVDFSIVKCDWETFDIL